MKRRVDYREADLNVGELRQLFRHLIHLQNEYNSINKLNEPNEKNEKTMKLNFLKK